MTVIPSLAVLVALAVQAGAAAAAPAAHPHLFFSSDEVPELRRRAESTPWLQQTRAGVIATANGFLATPTDPYPVLGDGAGIAGRALQQRVGLLAFAGYLTGDERYFRKGVEILVAVAQQTEPDNPAHWRTHLQYSDAAQAFAIGYDWLAPHMTLEQRAVVRAEIEAFGHLLFTDESTWGMPDPGVSSCNHNAVQFGALGLCALVLGDRPEWRERATDRVRAFFRHFMDETGYVTEGHDYQAYGKLGSLPFAWALHRHGGPDLVAERENFPLTSDQILWKLLPFEGRMLAMNDNNANAGAATVVYPMLRYRQPVHLWAWWESVKNAGAGIGTLREGLAAPFLFIWSREPLEPVAPPANFPLGRRFESGRVFLRDSWTSRDAAHVSFTSGYDFHRGHNHQDENAVTLYALGEGFLIDPGYYPAGSRSHNTLRSIEGAVQEPNSSGRVIAYREDEHGAFVRGQAPEAYTWVKDHAENIGLVGHFDRKVYFVRGPQPYLVWRDDAQVETNNPQAEYVAQFVTEPKNQVDVRADGFEIRGFRTGARCRVRMYSRVPVTFAEEDLAGQVFNTRGRTHEYARYYRGITATSVAPNPRFVTVAYPFRGDAELPEMTFAPESGDRIVCTLTFADGRVDRLVLSGTDVELTRSATPAPRSQP